MSQENSKMVEAISVLKSGIGGTVQCPLFSESNVRYMIPIYQRAFAWGVEKVGDVNYMNEIERLMDDICDAEEENYYIGSLVVLRKEDSQDQMLFEVIDGQQRLTALYIILKSLNGYDQKFNIPMSSPIDYDCRSKSRLAINHIDDIVKAVNGRNWEIVSQNDENDDKNGQWRYNGNDLENSICNGVRTVFRRFEKEDGYCDKLFDNLQKVKLFRIEVPQDTDLNKYFEIMNVRGLQLEPSDIVKAQLMAHLKSDREKEWFARIWNACKDMSGYVQMHFENGVREKVFGHYWDSPPTDKTVREAMEPEQGTILSVPKGGSSQGVSIVDALLNPTAGANIDLENENDNQRDDGEGHFGSIIEFPYFLLHSLAVVSINWQKLPVDRPKQSPSSMDAKTLVKAFNSVDWDAKHAWDFVICLLRYRFLFDKYIIKRDYADDPDGAWSLKELKRTGYQSLDESLECLMIQSCLRVTYTSPKDMHWIRGLLGMLSAKKERNIPVAEVARWCEAFAKERAKDDWKVLTTANYRLGTKTSHLLFNYLDYLLWKRDKNQHFVFEFRNSVEHWYPQHPDPDATGLEEWTSTDGNNHLDRDRFGNLCLLTVKMNSRFSNLSPDAKAKYQKKSDVDKNGSLKYRSMIAQMATCTNEEWKNTQCEVHEKEMIKVLEDDFKKEIVRDLPESIDGGIVQHVIEDSPKDLPAENWLDILLHNAGALLEGYSRICQWEKFSGTDWMELLSERPEFADKCDWSKLSGADWALLLGSRPEFADKCDKWTEMDEEAWTCLLGRRPQFSKRQECPLPELGGSGWSAVLCGCPEMAEQCPWDRLNGSDWASLLQQQPQFSSRCSWDRLNGLDWETLLVSQPQFGTYCDWDKLSGINWAVLLKAQPQFADRCPWPMLRGWDWAVLLGGRPEFSDRCQWNVMKGLDWVKLLSDNPSFADRCPWSKLDDDDWEQLLAVHPQFADKRPVS